MAFLTLRSCKVAMLAVLAMSAGVMVSCKAASSEGGQPVQAEAAPPEPGKAPDRAVEMAAPQDPYVALRYRLDWIGYPIVSREAEVQFFDPYPDIVIVHDSRNTLTVMDAATGANRWSLNLGNPLNKFVGNVRLDGELLVSAETEAMFFDLRTGEMKKRQAMGELVNTRPVVFGNIAVYGCATGEVVGHNLFSGYKQWGYKLRGRITANPVRVGSLVGVVSQAGDVVFLDPASGASYSRRRQIFAGLENDPVAGEGILYIAGVDQSVWAIAAEDARVVWRDRTSFPLHAQPSYHDGRLYVAVPHDGFVAYDGGTGSRLWTNPQVQGEAIALRNDRLIVWDGREVTALEAATGDVAYRAELPGVSRLVSDRFADGYLYAVHRSGEVRKFSPRN